MVRAHGGKRDNVFCGRIHSRLGFQGQSDNSFKMENFRRGKHLPCTAQPRRLHYGLPAKMVGRLEEKVAEASFSDVRTQALLMELFSKAHSFGCDKQGRINLNDKLLEHADIQSKAVLVGNFSAFAIWSEGRYASRESADQRNIFDAMRELGL